MAWKGSLACVLLCVISSVANPGLFLYNGTVLRNVPISTSNDQAGIVAFAKLVQGHTAEHTANQFCKDKPAKINLGKSDAECVTYLTTAFRKLYAEETSRREEELALLTPEQSKQAAVVAALLRNDPLKLRPVMHALEGSNVDVAYRIGTLYAALDAALGWVGNAGKNHPGYSEGYCSPEQAMSWAIYTQQFVKADSHMCQIGFNGGHSATALLTGQKGTTLTSFDIGQPFMSTAAVLIERMFGSERHSLVIGDSTETLKSYEPSSLCDLILIDGAHTHRAVAQDLRNGRRISRCNATVLLDDWRDPAVWSAIEEAVHEKILLPGNRILKPAPPAGGFDESRRCQDGCSTLMVQFTPGEACGAEYVPPQWAMASMPQGDLPNNPASSVSTDELQAQIAKLNAHSDVLAAKMQFGQAAQLQSQVQQLQSQLNKARKVAPVADVRSKPAEARPRAPKEPQVSNGPKKPRQYSGGGPKCDNHEHCESWPQTPHCVNGWCSSEPRTGPAAAAQSPSCDACESVAALESKMSRKMEHLEWTVADLHKQVAVQSAQIWVGCWTLVVILCAGLVWLMVPVSPVSKRAVEEAEMPNDHANDDSCDEEQENDRCDEDNNLTTENSCDENNSRIGE